MDQDIISHPENPDQPQADLAQTLAKRGSRMTGLSSGQTLALVGRVFRQMEHSQVWVPNVGSSPGMVERFSRDVAQRYPDLARKYQVEPPEENVENQGETDALVLAPGGMTAPVNWQTEPDLAASPPDISQGLPQARPARPEASQPVPPAMVIHSPEPIQRRGNVRPVSRVEEIKPRLSAGPDSQPTTPVVPLPGPGGARQEIGPPKTGPDVPASPVAERKEATESGLLDRSPAEPPIQRMAQPTGEQAPLAQPARTPPVLPAGADIVEEGRELPDDELPTRPSSMDIPPAAFPPHLAEADQPRAGMHEPGAAKLPLKPVQRQPDRIESPGEALSSPTSPAVEQETIQSKVSEEDAHPEGRPAATPAISQEDDPKQGHPARTAPESLPSDVVRPSLPLAEIGKQANIQRTPAKIPVDRPLQEPPAEGSPQPGEQPISASLPVVPASKEAQRKVTAPAEVDARSADRKEAARAAEDKLSGGELGVVRTGDRPAIQRAEDFLLAPVRGSQADTTPVLPPVSRDDEIEPANPTEAKAEGGIGRPTSPEIRRRAIEPDNAARVLPEAREKRSQLDEAQEDNPAPAHSLDRMADTAPQLPLAPANRIARQAEEQKTLSADTATSPEPPTISAPGQEQASPLIRQEASYSLDETPADPEPADLEKPQPPGGERPPLPLRRQVDLSPQEIRRSMAGEEKETPLATEERTGTRSPAPGLPQAPVRPQAASIQGENSLPVAEEKAALPLASKRVEVPGGLVNRKIATGTEVKVEGRPDHPPKADTQGETKTVVQPETGVATGSGVERRKAIEPVTGPEPLPGAGLNPAIETGSIAELPGLEPPGSVSEPAKTPVEPPLPARMLPLDLPKPVRKRSAPQTESHVQTGPGVDLGQSLLARAAVRANLPVTARSPVMQRRRAPASPSRPSSETGVFPQSVSERRGPTLFSMAESPAVNPQARFDLQRDYDPGLAQLEKPASREMTPPGSLYAKAVRPAETVHRMVVETGTGQPASVEEPESGKETPFSEEEAAESPPPVEQIQRMLAKGDFNPPLQSPKSGLVQRAQTEIETQAADRDQSEINLDQLARQVYPIIKRLLAVERERLRGRQ